MNPGRFVWEIVIGAFLSVAAVALPAVMLQEGLDIAGRREARRLERLIEPELQKAHRQQDGIALEEGVQVLSRIPGVSWAAVVDSDEKFMAHSRLSLLGKAWRGTPEAHDLWSFSLRNDQGRWGTLVFTLSGDGARSLWRRQVLWGIASCAGLWLGFVLWAGILNRRLAKLSAALAEGGTLLTEERDKNRCLDAAHQEARKVSEALLHATIDRVPGGMILLDQRQRVAALNQEAARHLNIQDGTSLIGKAWAEIPMLASCGAFLERSLQSPGIELEITESGDEEALTIQTSADGSGTWVTLFPSKRVVK